MHAFAPHTPWFGQMLLARSSYIKPFIAERCRSQNKRFARCTKPLAMAKQVLVPIANGSEEMEAVITIDVLRRAGADVTVASVEDTKEVTCSRGVKLVADALITECTEKLYDLVALPGGMPGAERLRDSGALQKILQAQKAAARQYAAICASPAVVFQPAGLLNDKQATCHPAFVDKLADKGSVAERVVVDGALTTSRGPGTTFEFALALVKGLYGEDKAKEVAGPMVMYANNIV